MLLFTLDTNFEASDYNITMQQPSDNVRLKIQVLDIKNGMYVLFDIVFSWFDVFFLTQFLMCILSSKTKIYFKITKI